MGAKNERGLVRWTPAAIGLACALGIVLGLVLAWRVWPLRWNNTAPSALRVEYQMDYVLTTADSLAITADVGVAKQRLAALVDEDTTLAQVANLVANVERERERQGDAAGAVRVRQLATLTGLSAGSSDRFDAAKRNIGVVIARLGVVLLVALAVVGVIALVGWFLSRRGIRLDEWLRRGSSKKSEPWPVEEDDGAYAAPQSDSDTVVLPSVAIQPYTEEPMRPPAPPAEVDAEGPPKEQGPQREVTLAHLPIALKRRATDEPQEREVRATAARKGALGNFEAEYSFGQDDFDCSFSIETADGEFYGECGIGVANVLSFAGVQKVDAFELWLFDKSDIRTVSTVLVTPSVADDEELLHALEAKGAIVRAQPGLETVLETPSMRVTATLTECRFADDGALADAYFASLTVDLLVDRGVGEAD